MGQITNFTDLGNLIGIDLRPFAGSTSTSTKIGFYGSAPVSRPTGYTQTYSAAARTTVDPVTGLGGSDYAADFATLASNLRTIAQVLNSVIDDLQALGLLQ